MTPDGRYLVVRGRLWRRSNPALDPAVRAQHVAALMAARRAVAAAKRTGQGMADARAAVDAAKRALGERGPVWWDDGVPDENRRMAKNTRYAAWFAALDTASPDTASPDTASPDTASPDTGTADR